MFEKLTISECICNFYMQLFEDRGGPNPTVVNFSIIWKPVNCIALQIN